MVAATDDLGTRLLVSIDTFFDGIQHSDINTFKADWTNIDKDFVNNCDAGTLDSDTSLRAVGVSDFMQLLCDAFIDLEVKVEGRAAELHEDLIAEATEDDHTYPRSPSPSRATRSPSPSSSSQLPSGNLPSYIPPSYTWLLSNLHNPYPSTTIRDTIASTTNTPRRLIDAWFVDVRRRIGWTNLIEGRSGLKGGGALTHGKGTPGVRRPHKTLGPPPNPINNLVNGITEVPKYKTRKELVAAATRFFVKPVVDTSDVGMGLAFSANANHLSASENQTFTVMADTARMLYRDKLHPTELAVAVTSRVKQWTPGLGEMAKEVREEERRRKRSRGVKREEEEEEEEEYSSDGKKRKRYTSPSDSSTPSSSAPTTPTDATFPSPNPNTNLKRKRAVSFADPASTSSFPTVSPSTKRLRSALNSAGVSRSVSDPTPMPLPQQQQTQSSQQQQQTQIPKPPPLTFDGFPAPVLDSWFTSLTSPPSQSESQGFALEKDFGNQWIDPLFFGFPDPVIRSSEQQEQEHGDASNRFAYFSGNANVDVTIPDLHSAFPVFPSSSSSSSSSLPSTPALSASGSLTEEESEERDSLFGDGEGEGEECAVGVYAGGDGKSLTPGDILGGNTNNNNNNNTTNNDNTTATTTTTNVADNTNTYPDYPPTNLPTLPDLSSLSSLPDLTSFPTFPTSTFPTSTFPTSASTFPNTSNLSSSSFDTFDFSSFPSLPEFNLNLDSEFNLEEGFPDFLVDPGFGSNVNVDFGFGFGSFGVGGGAGNGDGGAGNGDGDVDVDSFVAMLQSQSQTQSQNQSLPQPQTQTQAQSQTQPRPQIPWAGPTPTRERFGAIAIAPPATTAMVGTNA
uniref:HD1 homeodomain mating-type protein Le.a1-2 n=1 Tax=Lentinula edodes TaxID=5353 RepID=G9FIM2_LENED|nr:HD1 homeodomain mating-type protein Le.a1-2 [Lentinula edodes]